MRKTIFTPPVDMGRGWSALWATSHEVDGPIWLVCLERYSPLGGTHTSGMRLDVAKGIFIDVPPTAPAKFPKRAVARLTKAIFGKSPILEQVAEDLRGRLAGMVPDIAALAAGMGQSPTKPPVVREVEEILRSRAFGCYTDKVAQLCSKLTGHKINHKPEPPKPWPPGAFLVVRADRESALSSCLKRGEVVFAVGNVRGFGTNIFSVHTGMRADGTVGSHLDSESARPATRPEIERFLSKATARALVVLAEILERREK